MKKLFCACFFMSIISVAGANWEQSGYYRDNGSRLTVAFRGGMSMPKMTMQNDLGSISVNYYADDNNTLFVGDAACTGETGTCTYIGTVDIGDLSVKEKYDSIPWVGNVAVGMSLAGNSQVRVELDWLHVAESNYNSNPLFSDDVEMSIGTVSNNVASARSTVQTDVISAMVYYDFFDGAVKPIKKFIPYIGVGMGYATSKTVLSLADDYHDLPVSFDDFGEQNGLITDFYTSETETNNFALSGAVGFSYGIDEGVFFDCGARVTYIPEIRWALNNGADESASTVKERDVFSAHNIIYTMAYAGVRFEF